ncbi:MAG TPA: YceI family protein, partial [bacterium]|nr:YceI family protein [bacterium]
MSRIFPVATTLLSVAALGVAGFAYYQAWLNQPLEEADEPAAVEIGDVAGVAAAPGELALELRAQDEGGNTQMLWRCGKVLAGVRHDYVGAWTRLTGRVLVDPQSRTLRAGELHVVVNAMRGHGEHPAPNAMINTVRANQWFAPEHPMAVLKTRRVRPRKDGEQAPFAAAVDGWTHALDATLLLNGIERELTVFARIEVGERSLALDATFPVSRREFEVHKRQGFEPPADVDDQVLVDVRIRATPDPLAVIAELHRELVAQQARSGVLAQQVETLAGRLDRVENDQAELQRQLEAARAEVAAAGGAAGAAPTELPARFTDHVDYRNERGDEHIDDLGYQVPFEMVLISGDPAKGIKPFYLQTTEVTWKMFRAWSYCTDIKDPSYAAKLKDELLRPTPCYED